MSHFIYKNYITNIKFDLLANETETFRLQSWYLTTIHCKLCTQGSYRGLYTRTPKGSYRSLNFYIGCFAVYMITPEFKQKLVFLILINVRVSKNWLCLSLT